MKPSLALPDIFCYPESMETTLLHIMHEGQRVPIHFVTSDQHVSHVNIARLADRPFDNSESTEDMDNTLIERWNSVVMPEDNVLVLGDIALGKIDLSLPKWKQFNGTKYLVPGNHDRISSVEKPARRERFAPMYEEAGFVILPEIISVFAEMGTDNVEMLASHYPYRGDSQEAERHVELRPIDEGKLLLHGHTHADVATKPEFPRQFHVGVDAHDLTPVASSVITEWVAQSV